jgi:hypothetical protein
MVALPEDSSQCGIRYTKIWLESMVLCSINDQDIEAKFGYVIMDGGRLEVQIYFLFMST